jgi:hypothetical protein
MNFKEYIGVVKETMFERYEDAKEGIAMHNIATVNADSEVYRDYYNDGLTPLEAIIEIEEDNK